MSAAKLAAEARRAKILARASKNTVSAVGADDEEPVINIDTAGAVKERPLAARKSRVEAAAAAVAAAEAEAAAEIPTETTYSGSKEVDDDSPVPSSSSAKVDHSDPDVESIDMHLAVQEPSSPATPTVTPPKKKYVYEKKTLAEIEKEVAENTAKFDRNTLGEEVKGSKTEKAEKGDEKRDTEVKDSITDENANSSKNEVKVKKEASGEAKPKSAKPKSALAPQAIVTILRITLLIFFATFSGYQCVSESIALSHLNQPSNFGTAASINLNAGVGHSEIVIGDGEEFVEMTQDQDDMQEFQQQQLKVVKTPRTWTGWLRSFLECSVSAMMVASWVAGAFSSYIHRKLRVKENKTSLFSISTVMSLWTNGLSSVWDSVYATIGEISLHAVFLILSTTLFTLLLSSNSTYSIERGAGGGGGSGTAGTTSEEL